MLMDRYNRSVNYIRISVTDRCNLRCKYCVTDNFPFIPHEEILRYEEIIRFVKICADLGVSKIRLTGGEPLTRNGVHFLIKEIAATEGIEDVGLTTNGTHLGRQISSLREAGLTRVNISLDTMKRDRFAFITGVDAFDDVMKSIRISLDHGLSPVKINTVIIRGFNDDEILDFVRFASSFGVVVRFIEFMPFGESDLWDSSRTVSSREIEDLIRREYDLESSPDSARGPAKMFQIKGSFGRIGFISPVSTHICHECNRIRLTSRGTIKPCLFGEEEYDVRSLLRNGARDDAISRFIMDAVKAKPERKPEMGQIKKCQRNLRSIGG